MNFRVLPLFAAALLVACSGEDGAQGPAGPPGPSTTDNGTTGANASTNVVTPGSGFLGRELDIQIGFTGTKFEAGAKPTVDLGAGVTVSDVNVASPTLITAHVTIDAEAEVGTHDVKVGDVVAKGAFKVAPALDVQEAAKAEQGGLGGWLVTNSDVYGFDTAEGAFAMEAGEDLLAYSASATGAYGAQALFLVPPKAAAGKFQLSAHNLDATGAPVVSFYSAKDALVVGARDATAVTLGTAMNGQAFGGAFGSKLYKFSTATDDAIVVLNMHVDDLTSLNGFLWASGGKAQDIAGVVQAVDQSIFGPIPKDPPYDIAFVLPTSGAAREYFLSAVDTSGETGTKFDLAPQTVAAPALTEGNGAHADFEAAQSLNVGNANLVKGEITDANADWYKITVADGEIVEASIDSGSSNLEVSIQGLEDGAPTEIGYGTGGVGKLAVVPTGALTAGDYYLKVGKAYGETTALTGKYTVGIRRIH